MDRVKTVARELSRVMSKLMDKKKLALNETMIAYMEMVKDYPSKIYEWFLFVRKDNDPKYPRIRRAPSEVVDEPIPTDQDEKFAKPKKSTSDKSISSTASTSSSVAYTIPKIRSKHRKGASSQGSDEDLFEKESPKPSGSGTVTAAKKIKRGRLTEEEKRHRDYAKNSMPKKPKKHVPPFQKEMDSGWKGYHESRQGRPK